MAQSAAATSPRRVALPGLASMLTSTRSWAVAVVEGRGRVTLLSVAGVLGWDRGTGLDVRERAGLIVVTADARGEVRMNRQGRVQVPVGIRRWCGLASGSRVLLVAEPTERRLVLHPPAALDALIAQRHAEVLGGDPR